jgi:hypothetical protein
MHTQDQALCGVVTNINEQGDRLTIVEDIKDEVREGGRRRKKEGEGGRRREKEEGEAEGEGGTHTQDQALCGIVTNINEQGDRLTIVENIKDELTGGWREEEAGGRKRREGGGKEEGEGGRRRGLEKGVEEEEGGRRGRNN